MTSTFVAFFTPLLMINGSPSSSELLNLLPPEEAGDTDTAIDFDVGLGLFAVTLNFFPFVSGPL